ncbi:hypothetical protein KFL_000130210 [Klebsormidium nitens]|uniref:Myb-like domain-containing protein n=1 Tax=Klebsormidium nitens TaxID=105231 RepID=A0A1Y1HIV3_KLENI|nr:hypothetical protein KFL_000130210 [Klebsormidium nitens]|eukprot:GAQ78440.1 hypothetical protein KFL_000130210 [Klebsormidium nitens]
MLEKAGMGPDPKAWVLEELLAEGDTSLELIQACQIPAEVLDAAPLLLKQRFALHLLRDVLQGGRVPGAVLQLVKLLAVPQLGGEDNTDSLTSEVKLQVCISILKGEEGSSRRNWKGFANCVTQLFGNEEDQSEAAKAAHDDLKTVLQSTAKKHREAALEKLLEKHPVDNVLNDLKALLDTATQHMPTTTTLKRLEENPYAPQPVPSTNTVREGTLGGRALENGSGGAATKVQNGGADNAMVADFGAPEDDQDQPPEATHDAPTPTAVKLGPRRKVTEKRPEAPPGLLEDSPLQSSPDLGPPKRGRKPGVGKRKRAILSDSEGGSPGMELALMESPPKRGPGRPRIHPKPDPEQPKRPRGRPRVYENGAPPRSPMRRRKSGPAKAGMASPEQASPLGGRAERGGGAGPVQGGAVNVADEEEEETTPLKRRRVVADKRGAGVGGDRAGPQAENVEFPPVDDDVGAPPQDSQMDDALSPPDHQPPPTLPENLPPGGASAPPREGARRKGLKMLEELEMASRGAEAVDVAMPELGPEEEAGGDHNAQFLTLTEDGSNDWCCLCDAKVEDVGALLLCTGCANATCYACAGVSETPPLEYICPLCLAKLKKKREKEIRAKLEATRRLNHDGPPASLPGPSAPPPGPVSRLVEHLEPGPSTQPPPPPEECQSEPREADERPGPSTGQDIPGQEEMPELPDEEPGAAENGDAKKEEAEAKAEERTRSEEGRRNNRYWSDEEIKRLKDAFAMYVKDENKHRIPWEAIRAYGLRHGVFQERRGVDLKDKWRNLKKAEEKAALA